MRYALIVVLGVSVFAGCSAKDATKSDEENTERYFQRSHACDSGAMQNANIILISLDALAADHLETYGYARETAPSLAQLAREAVVFTNVFSPATWTLPAHMSLFTSLHPSAHRIYDWNKTVEHLPYQTLAELLKSAGYYTMAFTDSGFVSSIFGFGKGFDEYVEVGYGIQEKTKTAIDWIENHKDMRFFLFLHTYEIHDYLFARPEHAQYYAAQYDGRIKGNVEAIVTSKKARKAFQPLPEDIQYIIDLYDGTIRYTDICLRDFFQALREMGLWEDTMLIITSDHGESFGDRHNNNRFAAWNHGGIPYESQIHIPLIIKMPEKTGIGHKVITAQHSLLDIMPTLADLLELEPAHILQGRSLMPMVDRDDSDEEHIPLFAMTAPQEGLNTILSARSDGFKYIVKDFGHGMRTEELYNLELDPGEQNNLLLNRDSSNKRAEFADLIKGYLDRCGEYDLSFESGRDMPPEFKEKLKALGYLK